MWTRSSLGSRFAKGVVAALCSGSLSCAALGFEALGFGVRGFGVRGLGSLVFGSLAFGGWGSAALLGCASQRDTATALAIAGTAAVIVGASMAADDGQCYSSAEGGPPYCSPGLSRAARRAGTATAIAGAGMAGAGYALQPKGPDQNTPAAGVLPAPASYRLVRPLPQPESGNEPIGPAEPDPSVAAPDPERGTTGTTATAAAARGTSSPTGPSSNSPAPPASHIDSKCGPTAGQNSRDAAAGACQAAPPPGELP